MYGFIHGLPEVGSRIPSLKLQTPKQRCLPGQDIGGSSTNFYEADSHYQQVEK